MKHKMEFTSGESVEVADGVNLADCDEMFDTPVLFGCRSGSCGTCVLQVVEGMDNISGMLADEKDCIPSVTKESNCRLACQIHIEGPVKLTYLGN